MSKSAKYREYEPNNLEWLSQAWHRLRYYSTSTKWATNMILLTQIYEFRKYIALYIYHIQLTLIRKTGMGFGSIVFLNANIKALHERLKCKLYECVQNKGFHLTKERYQLCIHHTHTHIHT